MSNNKGEQSVWPSSAGHFNTGMTFDQGLQAVTGASRDGTEEQIQGQHEGPETVPAWVLRGQHSGERAGAEQAKGQCEVIRPQRPQSLIRWDSSTSPQSETRNLSGDPEQTCHSPTCIFMG